MTKELTLYNVAGWYFPAPYDCDKFVCGSFVRRVLGRNSARIRLVLSDTNPRKRGWRKVTQKHEYVRMGGRLFSVTREQQIFLDKAGFGESFWVTVKRA
jgi:hypothetical protein